MSDMRQMTELGRRIESDSFRIVDEEAGEHRHGSDEWEVVRRVIHSTADFEFKDLMHFGEGSVARGVEALRRGAPVVADVKMILAGLNPQRLSVHGSETHCFISDEDVIADARSEGSTRAVFAMRKARALGLLDGAIVAVGNAPTALIETMRLAREEGVRPAWICGVPVGFVSAAESKELVLEQAGDLDVPYAISRGRKGGSTIAVAIVHALLTLTEQGDQR
ncbi:MAG: precorrin-8X methylmutase [Planctomycetota bacterium]